MRKRRFKKRGCSLQSRVYGFLALHTNFQALRKAEVRRMPRTRTSPSRSSTKFVSRVLNGAKQSPQSHPPQRRRLPEQVRFTTSVLRDREHIVLWSTDFSGHRY